MFPGLDKQSWLAALGRCALLWWFTLNPALADNFTLSAKPPPGFEDLTGTQTTQADVYFGGEFLASTFVEFDPYHVTIKEPLQVVQQIPNLKDPRTVAQVLTGPLPTHADQLCSSRRRENCGRLSPALAGVIFDEGRYRLTLFIHPAQLLVHNLALEKYLPRANAGTSGLHNVRMSASGTGDERQFSLSSESYLAHNQSRLHARYGLTNEGATLYALAWQHDSRDMEYAVGSFRTQAGNLSFAADVDVLGLRIASSTKSRTDLDHALGTPVLIFLRERSRVDIYRGNELLASRFYPAGNQQIDTSSLPDGAYDIAIRIEEGSGAVREQTQFFVRSGQMPPMDTPQFYLEGGSLLREVEQGLPELGSGAWLRFGASRRLRKNLAWDNEFLYADNTTAIQSGASWLRPGVYLYGGGMFTDNADVGVLFRGNIQRETFYASFDLRHVTGREPLVTDEYSISRGGYTQLFANVGLPFAQGYLYLRGRYSNRADSRDTELGVSYLGSIWERHTRGMGVSAELVVDGGTGSMDTWIRAGVNIRWQRNRGRATSLSPRVRLDDAGVQPELHGYWQNPVEIAGLAGLGALRQTVYVDHAEARSALGVRYVPDRFRQSDFELGYQRNRQRSDLFYALNNRFSVVNTPGGTTYGDGGGSAGAVIVEIEGSFTGKFAVLVGNRVVGHAWVGQPNIISLRSYERYNVRIKPVGDKIVGYDQAPQQVTLYPGNVQTLRFAAHELNVMIGQALLPDGSPVKLGRFVNVEGYGRTDQLGWFQVEVAHNKPLEIDLPNGERCWLIPPQRALALAENGLVVMDPQTCQPTPEKPLAG